LPPTQLTRKDVIAEALWLGPQRDVAIILVSADFPELAELGSDITPSS
jgi:hypothetical protein